MKNNEQFELFYDLIRLVYTDIGKVNYYIKSQKLSPSEIKILKAFKLFKASKFQEAEKNLAQVLPETFFEGLRLYILGLIKTHKGNFNFAIEKFTDATQAFKEINDTKGIYRSTLALFDCYINRKEIKPLEQLLKQSIEYSPNNKEAQLVTIRNKALICQLNNKPKQTLEHLKMAMEMKDLTNYSSELKTLLIIKVCAFVQLRQYDNCYQTLDIYKKSGGFSTPSNYKYMKTLLDFITKQKTIYVYKKDFQFMDELYDQLTCLKELQTGNINEAINIWRKLQKHNPKLYRDNFNFYAEDSLFSQALNLLYNNEEVTTLDTNIINSLSTPLEKICYIFEQLQSTGIDKNELFFYLFQKYPETEKDFSKLRFYISQARKKHQLKIESKQGHYKAA